MSYPEPWGLRVRSHVLALSTAHLHVVGRRIRALPTPQSDGCRGGTMFMVPSWLMLLDHNYTDVQFSAKLGDFRSHLSMAPSEYFARNCGIGASCVPRRDLDMKIRLVSSKSCGVVTSRIRKAHGQTRLSTMSTPSKALMLTRVVRFWRERDSVLRTGWRLFKQFGR